MSGFKTQSKRNRELAKLNKRKAKDEKRALRKAARSPSAVAAIPPVTIAASHKPPPGASRYAAAPPAPGEPKPLTLAQAVERWKATKVVKAKPRW